MNAGDTDDRTTWTTPAPALAAVAAGGVALGIAAVFAADAPSMVLVGVAALGLLGLAGLGLRQRPRVTIVPGAEPRLVVRGLTGPVSYTRPQILRARITHYRRLGRKTPMLELDVERPDHDDDRLLIFGRWDLGTNPEELFEAMLRHNLVHRG
ncbi:PH domain-containing protein [Nocardia sp. NPDC057227]|uniref:PH domain-containing protein n=1 Tax=Nocardia sp. NPDC057227 TaxID=3346056 RepID=UPI003639B2C6